MKFFALGLLVFSLAGLGGEVPVQSKSLLALHQMTNAEAAGRLPIQFEATVTYYRDYDLDLFVQDGESAIYVSYHMGAQLLPGDRVVVRGRMQESFRPIVVADEVRVLHHGTPPEPINITASELFGAERDSMLASVHGTVRSAQMVWSAGHRNIYLKIMIDGGSIDAAVNSDDATATSKLLDADVQVTGIATSEFDQKMQQSGARLDVQSLGDIRITKQASGNPNLLPVTPMENVLHGYHVRDLSERVQIKGTITYYQPRRAVVLQSGAQSLWIATQTDVPLKLGDIAYASGFPNVRNGYLTLEDGEIRDTHVAAPIAPRFLNWDQIGFGEYAFNFVSTEGELVMEAREASQDEFLLTSHGHLYSAIYRHPRGMSESDLPPLKQLPLRSLVRVSGINMFYNSDPFDGPVESNLLLRSFDDVTVIGQPPLLSTRNLEIAIGVLLLLTLLIAGRGWRLEHTVRRQAAAAADRNLKEAGIERQRSRILEKINGTGPLAEILEMVVELVSLQMSGVPCWCETRDGDRFGNYPQSDVGLNIIREEILAGSRAGLGHVMAGLSSSTTPNPTESEALRKAASLASLAIETRRFHADLVRRVDVDTLTEAYSRYFIEREIDDLIGLSEANMGTLGLIYFDLDDFKSVNDCFGHRIGDQYLQQVSARIKSQLRSQDKFARFGGDEFAILIPLVRNRVDLEEIVKRFESSLNQPIVIEGQELRLSASFGLAIYPKDGANRQQLLEFADNAMYTAKLQRKNMRIPHSHLEDGELSNSSRP